jgi:hypothetical protein
MSDVSSTAPTWNRQIARGVILLSILGGCTWFSSSSSNNVSTIGVSQHSIVLLHLVAFAAWFGCSVWVSFIAGLIMFKNLPRHVFGRLQSKLFPAYFQFSAASIGIAILTSGGLSGSVGAEASNISLTPLIAVMASILINLFYFEPETTRVMYQRHAVEKRLGTGHEVGQLRPDDPKKANDPELKALSKKFGMLHGFSTLMNLAALGFGCVWLSRCADVMVKQQNARINGLG